MDPNSNSNLHEIRTDHLHLELNVDFDHKVLSGFVELQMTSLVNGCQHIVLDTKNEMKCTRATKFEGDQEKELKFEIGSAQFQKYTCSELGTALAIHLPAPLSASEKVRVRVHYSTSPSASGIQWLEASQTDEKKYPYLFSQFQAIHCRSTVPCQDAPAHKFTYTAKIRVPSPLVALMSAVGVKEEKEEGHVSYYFEQKVPIPSYLIALVVGHLKSQAIGPRTKVWTEKEEKLKAACYEFEETEDYLKTAETFLNIPYCWGKYDILLLPGSFPYGGMENPTLTFVTPTLLAGDRSLSSVICHEISHSWTGNLITNETWEHFWLNEGFTVYLERAIIGELRGEKVRHLHAAIGASSLRDSVDSYGATHGFTALIPTLTNGDPDDAFSSVPYEKGFQFLFYLEHLVGKDQMRAFLHFYLDRFKYQSIKSDAFKSSFLEFFSGKEVQEKLKEVDWEKWFHQPGMPIVKIDNYLDKTLLTASEELAKKWTEKKGEGCTDQDLKGWTSNQIVIFLERVLSAPPLGAEGLDKMDQLYHFSQTKNSEIKFKWFMIGIANEYTKVYPHIAEFLKEQGRMKFVRPLYRKLFQSATGKEVALKTFEQTKDQYHSITRKMAASDLQLTL